MSCKDLLPYSSAFFARLTNELPHCIQGVSNPVQYTFYVDILFSSPKLFLLLREKDIAAVGTVRLRISGFPKALKVRGKKNFRLDWNSLGIDIFEEGFVIGPTWTDNGPDQMKKTAHHG